MQTRPVRQGIAYMILAVAAVTVTARPARAQNGFQVLIDRFYRDPSASVRAKIASGFSTDDLPGEFRTS